MIQDFDVFCLHGFLGHGKDFECLRSIVANQSQLIAPDRCSPTASEVTSLEAEAQSIALQLQRPSVIVGYSHGARLALHIALDHPKNVLGLVLVSSHFGLDTEADRAARRQQDEVWAKRFEFENWQDTLLAWNAQPTLAASRPNKVSEASFDRRKLAQSLRLQGLGSMQSLWSRLTSVQCPCMLVVGERDQKFTELAKRAALLLPNSVVAVIAGAGHRVLLDAPEAFAAQVTRALKHWRLPIK
jgi:2-succinyl-6-hydroxy-2,4-cyclohexadiene-1-carboxylate synthase